MRKESQPPRERKEISCAGWQHWWYHKVGLFAVPGLNQSRIHTTREAIQKSTSRFTLIFINIIVSGYRGLLNPQTLVLHSIDGVH